MNICSQFLWKETFSTTMMWNVIYPSNLFFLILDLYHKWICSIINIKIWFLSIKIMENWILSCCTYIISLILLLYKYLHNILDFTSCTAKTEIFSHWFFIEKVANLRCIVQFLVLLWCQCGTTVDTNYSIKLQSRCYFRRIF